MNEELETTAGLPAEPAPDPAPAAAKQQAKPKRRQRREEHALEGLFDIVIGAAHELLMTEYGTEGKDTADSVTRAMRKAAQQLEPDENRTPAVIALADAGGQKLLERRGIRDLGLVTKLGMACRRAAGIT